MQFANAGQFTPFTQMANITGLPAVSLPLSWSGEGLPIGVQLVGRPADEATLFRVSAQVERRARGATAARPSAEPPRAGRRVFHNQCLAPMVCRNPIDPSTACRSGHGVRRHAAVEQHRPQRPHAQHPHRLPRLQCRRAEVGDEDDVLELEQARVHLRLALEHVQGGAGDSPLAAAP